MIKLKSLNLKIPEPVHIILKTYCAENGINMLPKAEELLIKAIKKIKKNGTDKKSS